MKFASVVLCLLPLSACSRTPAPAGDPVASGKADAAGPAADPAKSPMPAGATDCSTPSGLTCWRFDTPEAAFRHVLTTDPLVLAIGEAHAQRGSEKLESSTKRFMESLLPIVAPKASDIVVELWIPDPSCRKETVRAVASAQKPVVEAQAETNQNEYVTLGVKAKAAGVTPWPLRPTCDELGTVADAGDDAVLKMLGFVKKLTQDKVVQLVTKNRADAGGGKSMVVAYNGALHNDLLPSAQMKEYSFGPELERFAGGRYTELDIIVPEYVKKSPSWERQAWFPAFEADRAANKETKKTTLYLVGQKSYTLIFPASGAASEKPH